MKTWQTKRYPISFFLSFHFFKGKLGEGFYQLHCDILAHIFINFQFECSVRLAFLYSCLPVDFVLVAHKHNNWKIVAAVMERIEAAGIWLPEQEVTKYFYRRKTHYRNRIEKELQPKPEMQDKDSQTQKEQGAGSQ